MSDQNIRGVSDFRLFVLAIKDELSSFGVLHEVAIKIVNGMKRMRRLRG
jgi:hypothetical protein